jgi:hypothetical protein
MRGGKTIFPTYKGGGNWDGKRRTKTNIPLVPNESVNGKGKQLFTYSIGRGVEK